MIDEQRSKPLWDEADYLSSQPRQLLISYTSTNSFNHLYDKAFTLRERLDDTYIHRFVGAFFENMACDYLAATRFNIPSTTVLSGSSVVELFSLLHPEADWIDNNFGQSLKGISVPDFLVVRVDHKNKPHIQNLGECSIYKEKNYQHAAMTFTILKERVDLRGLFSIESSFMSVGANQIEPPSRDIIYNNHNMEHYAMPVPALDIGWFIDSAINNLRKNNSKYIPPEEYAYLVK